MANHYQVLGIEQDATAAQIKDAYRRAAMRWHPDRNRDNVNEAERRFKEVGAAYAVLSDPERRRHYDDLLSQAEREPDDGGFDAEAAAEMFMREMVEMATAMAATGYNKDVLFGALLSQGVPESIASDLAARVIATRSKAQESAAAEQRAKAQRDRNAERQRQAAQRESEAQEARQRKDAAREASPSNSGGNAGVWILGLFFALIVVVGLSAGRKESAASSGASQPQSIARTEIGSTPATSSTSAIGQMAIAARKANVRGGPGVRFPIVALLSRGDTVRPTNKPSATSFVEIELANGKRGWIGQELLIDAVAARSLGETTPEAYAESRPIRLSQLVREADLLNFGRMMSTSNPANLNPTAESLIATVKMLAPVGATTAYPRDVDGLRWWTLEGRWLSDNGGAPMAVVMTAIAAVYADPNDAGALVALGMAAMKAGFYGPAFDRVVRALTITAPESTNTWVLVAAAAAHRSQPKIARAALDVAIGYSRDVKVTRAFIANVASESPVPLVAAAFGSMDPATVAAVAAQQTSPGSMPTTTSTGEIESAVSPSLRPVVQARFQCAGLSRYSESFHDQMSQLVKVASRTGAPTGYSADQAVFVGFMCADNVASAQAMIDSGKVGHDFAEKARQLLKSSMPAFKSQGIASASSN